MRPKFNPCQILRTVEDNELGHILRCFADEFAVLGYLDIARGLVSLNNKYAPLYRKNSSDVFKPLWLVWDMTGTWPEGEKAFVEQFMELGDQGGNKWKRNAITELAEQYEKSNWVSAGFKIKEEQLYDEIRLSDCVGKVCDFVGKGNERIMDVTSGRWAINKGSILLKALEIAIVLEGKGDSHAGEGLPDVDEIMGWITKRLDANQMIAHLTKTTKAWGLLKDGALAKAIRVKDEKVQELGSRVLETFKTRYEKGVQRGEIWNNSVEELVQIISHNTSTNRAAKRYREEVYGAEEEAEEGKGNRVATILKNPLSRNDIADLEKRLRIALPSDYKDFLAATNGMSASWGGIIEDAPLFSATEVRWITKEEDYFTNRTAELLPEVFNLIRDIYDNGHWPMVDTPLEIGRKDIDIVWLLPPVKVKELVSMYLTQRERSSQIRTCIENSMKAWAGSIEEFENLEWCVLVCADAEMTAYPSFKAFLVNKALESAEDNSSEGCFSYSCR